MERGHLVVAAFARDYGKPRPALVVQSDVYLPLPSITLLPLTSDLQPGMDFRIDVLPSTSNGLKQRCQVMIDKIQTLPAAKVGLPIGKLDAATQQRVDIALALFLGFA